MGYIITFILGILTTCFGSWLNNKDKAKIVVRKFQISKSNQEIKNMFEDNIRKQFGLDHTFLISPEIPIGLNFSRSKSPSPNGYFDYLIQNNINSYSFRFWDKNNKERWIEVEKTQTNELIIEVHFVPSECKKISEIFKKNL